MYIYIVYGTWKSSNYTFSENLISFNINMSTLKKLNLITSNGDTIEPGRGLLAKSGLLRSLLRTQNPDGDVLIHFEEVDTATLTLMEDYCRSSEFTSNQMLSSSMLVSINCFLDYLLQLE